MRCPPRSYEAKWSCLSTGYLALFAHLVTHRGTDNGNSSFAKFLRETLYGIYARDILNLVLQTSLAVASMSFSYHLWRNNMKA